MAEVTGNARNLTLSTAYKIEAILRGIEKVPHNLAGIIEKYSDDQNDLIWLINSALENNPEVFGAAIAFDPYAFNPNDLYFSPYGYRESDLIKFTYLGGESYQYFYWDWYQIPKELNVPIWTEPYYDEGGGNIIMSTFSVPFYKKMNGKNHFQGIVTSDVSLMWLKGIVSAVRIYQTGYAFLISQNGVFITHPEKELIMKESIFSISEANNDLRLRRIGQDMIKGGEGFAPLLNFTTGKKSWMYYAPLPSTHWSIGVVILEDELFAGVSNPLEATRYHSLIVKKETLPDCLEITAHTKEDEIMGLKHKQYPIYGVQFHPESILTRVGPRILNNFLAIKYPGR